MKAPTRDLKAKLWERDPHDWYVEPERPTELRWLNVEAAP